MDVAGKGLGRDGMDGALKGAGPAGPRALVDRLVRAVKLHATGREPHDDITVVALTRTA
jgi:serine phosphatase RsbU (regulator of sigma subunit)